MRKISAKASASKDYGQLLAAEMETGDAVEIDFH